MCWGFLFFWLEEWRRGGVRFGTVLRCLWGVVEPLQLHFLTAALACDATDWALSGSDVQSVHRQFIEGASRRLGLMCSLCTASRGVD